MNLNRAV